MRTSPILLSVALLCASAQVMATEARTDGEGSCADTSAPTSEPADDADPSAAAPARRTQKAKPTPTARGGGGSPAAQRGSVPRWHSFLPGMFR